ncbi:MAG: excinuclease ABC subunit UvrC [Magnetovibrionaceae bacterium]
MNDTPRDQLPSVLVTPKGEAPKAPDAPLGASVIEGYLATLPSSPGVYRMIDAKGDVLYVGKAKNLPKRVRAYTKPDRQSIRIRRMIAQTAAMEIVTTHTEAEALLLEANLIKRFKPRYNILLRDDKSFPFIHLTGDHDFPQVLKHRGAKPKSGSVFGPFASAWSVNQTLVVLQRAFLLRTCSDATFGTRTRPCLLYQIKRCSAPCVDRISAADYGALVEQARAFLTGDSRAIQDDLAERMQKASDALDFEEAAQYRDRLRALAHVQSRQDINPAGLSDADVIAAHGQGGQVCVQVFFFRSGRNNGNRAYFPAGTKDQDLADVLEAFVGQFYANKPVPGTLLLSHDLPHADLVAEALTVHAGRRVQINAPKRGEKRSVVQHAEANARDALTRRLAESATQTRLLEGLGEMLGLDQPPERVEVYDNSHVQGTNQVGAMIVAGPEGFMKPAYRRFNIKQTEQAGDDYGMMREVLTRRFTRAQKEDPDRQGGQWPDLVMIDGGKGQLSVVQDVFSDLGIEDVGLVAVSKGPDRNAGREKIHLGASGRVLEPEARDPVLYFIQRLRDEAHRFAIGGHRAKRSKDIKKSSLDGIPGIGPKRKKALLNHFGSAKGVEQAGLSDLESVEGINRQTAVKIYDWFHPTR